LPPLSASFECRGVGEKKDRLGFFKPRRSAVPATRRSPVVVSTFTASRGAVTSAVHSCFAAPSVKSKKTRLIPNSRTAPADTASNHAWKKVKKSFRTGLPMPDKA
jgi:hypothetical protein